MQPLVPFSRPVLTATAIDEVVATIASGWLTTGPRVAEFERAFSDYLGTSETLALNSCTAALHLSLLGCKVGAGDEVIVPGLTYCATANAVVHCGATPVVVDVQADSCAMNVDDLERKISPKTRAVIVVHFAGYPAPIARIRAITDRYGVALIEDCAHAIETEIDGQHAGTFGDFGAFSFYATKNITTGEGGALVARSPDRVGEARLLSLHGVSKGAWRRTGESSFRHYDVLAPGYKYNMMDLQAALGLHQLAAVGQNWLRREAIWAQYKVQLSDLPLDLPVDAPLGSRHGYHLFSVRVNNESLERGLTRDRVLEELSVRGIGTGVHYHALPEFSYFQEALGWRPDNTPIATDIGRRTFSLPLNPYLSGEDVDLVCASVRDIFDGRR